MKKIPKNERHQRLISEVNQRPGVLIRDIATKFGVSRETIRRDFDELSQRGILGRRYGGANPSPTGLVQSLETRQQLMRPEKELIAALACQLIAEHEVIMLGPGATVIFLAQQIASRNPDIVVITNSLGVALSLGQADKVRVLVAAGELEHKEAFMWGHETTDFLDKFSADSVFFSCDGVTPDGVMEVDSRTAWVERAMVRNSRRKVLLMDNSKFDQTSFERVCEIKEVDDMVCDQQPVGSLLKILTQAGVVIHTEAEPL